MFKKIIHIGLSSLLLITTIGMVVSKHYCQGNLYSVSIDGLNDNKCDMGDCCHDENNFFKVQEDFSTPQITTVPVLAEIDIIGQSLFAAEGIFIEEEESVNLFVYETPPLLPILKTLALKQVYLL